MKKTAKGFFLLWTTVALFGCGGGGGGVAGDGGKNPVDTTPTTAVVKLSTEGTLSAGTLIGLGFTLNLPAGVTVKTDSEGNVADGIVVRPGETASKAVVADYTPAAPPAPAKLNLIVAGTEEQGLATGELATVTCDLAPGTTLSATDFTVADVKAVDDQGHALADASSISGLSIRHSVEFK